jgi:phage terminase large subunit-like protein
LYDLNPTSTRYWVYRLFHNRLDPETNKALSNPNDYVSLRMNPEDNRENLPAEYLRQLELMPERMRRRFLRGEYDASTEDAYWTLEGIDRYRLDISNLRLPDMQRVIVAIDPSGADDELDTKNDEIGIVVVGLGTDGLGYVLEDLTLKAGPAAWGKVAVSAYDRWGADRIVAEVNFGGEMVRYVVQSVRPGVSFRKLTASRGKVQRAEPISALHEQGKIRFAGSFPELEDELCNFTSRGYLGDRSPNRADAMMWGFAELFPGLARQERLVVKREPVAIASWMS